MKNKLPNSWIETNLGDKEYFEILPSGINKFNGEKEYLSTESIQKTKIEKVECKITNNNRPSRANMQPILNSVWFAKMKSTLKVYSFDKENKEEVEKYILSTGFAGIRVNEKFVDVRYLRADLLTPNFNNIKDSYCSGATQKAIGNEKISKIKILLPPLETQKQIVEILERAERVKEKRKRANKLSAQYLKSIFYERFSIYLNKNSSKTRLGDQIEFMTSGSRGWAAYYSNSGNKFIRIQNVKDGLLNLEEVQYVNPPKTKEAERTRVEEGDLLISITADLGRTAVIDSKTAKEGAYINQHLVLLRLNKKVLDPSFLSFFIESDFGKKKIVALDQKGVKSGLNFNSIKGMEIPLPPIEQQKKFSLIIEGFERLKEKQNRSEEKISNLYNTLMQKAFVGDI